jgi:hypothetical protein
MPALIADCVLVSQIVCLVAFDLFSEVSARFGKAEVLAVFMPVPEPAVYEDDGVVCFYGCPSGLRFI